MEECFSSGAADTETERARAKAKMALWKAVFIFAACRKPRFESRLVRIAVVIDRRPDQQRLVKKVYSVRRIEGKRKVK